MKNLSQRYPRIFAGLWFSVFGLLAFTAIECTGFLPPSQASEWIPILIASLLSGFFMGPRFTKPFLTAKKAILWGILTGILALYLYFLVVSYYDTLISPEENKIQLVTLPFIHILNVLMAVLLPFVGLPIILLSGLAGWSLRRFIQGARICQK